MVGAGLFWILLTPSSSTNYSQGCDLFLLLCLASALVPGPSHLRFLPNHPHSTAGTQREPTGGTPGWGSCGAEKGDKNQCNTTIKEPGMWGAWLNDRQAGGGALSEGSRAPFPFSLPPALFSRFFFLSEIFLKQIGICFLQV